MTWTLTTSPIRLAAAAPASTAAFTAATSPATKRRDQAAADLVPADQVDVGRLQHRVAGLDQGDEPLAFDHAERFKRCVAIAALLRSVSRSRIGHQDAPGQGDVGRVRQVAAVRLVGVDVDLELPVGMGPHQQAFERRRAGALDPQVHPVRCLTP